MQLKQARIKQALSQEEVATILHVTRQAISKWENENGCPDLDNLIQLSKIYKIPMDKLVNNDIKFPQKKMLFSSTDENIMILVLAIISAIIPPIGIFVPFYVLKRNNKYSKLYKLILFISVIIISISIINTFILIKNYLPNTHITTYQFG